LQTEENHVSRPKNIEELISAINGLEADFKRIAGDGPHAPQFAREAEWAIQAITAKDYTVKVALGNPDAVYEAVLNIAGIGTTLDPAKKFAYLVPRDGRLKLDVSYMGLIDIAISSGSIRWAQAYRVYDKDAFKLGAYDRPPEHQRDPFAKDRGGVRGVYVVVKTADGDYLTNAMAIDDVHAIRARSPSWKAYVASQNTPNPKLCPWNTDAEEMEKKTVVKNAYKYWPRSDRLDRAVHYLNTDGGQGIDLAGEPSQAGTMLADGYLQELKDCADAAAVAAFWKKSREALKAAGDTDAYARVREAVAKRNHELGVTPPENGATQPQAATQAPKPDPKTKAGVLAIIAAVETDADLEATGPLIDALPQDALAECNEAYNTRLEYLNQKFGRTS
jgi:recombination protein RecT